MIVLVARSRARVVSAQGTKKAGKGGSDVNIPFPVCSRARTSRGPTDPASSANTLTAGIRGRPDHVDGGAAGGLHENRVDQLADGGHGAESSRRPGGHRIGRAGANMVGAVSFGLSPRSSRARRRRSSA